VERNDSFRHREQFAVSAEPVGEKPATNVKGCLPRAICAPYLSSVVEVAVVEVVLVVAVVAVVAVVVVVEVLTGDAAACAGTTTDCTTGRVHDFGTILRAAPEPIAFKSNRRPNSLSIKKLPHATKLLYRYSAAKTTGQLSCKQR